MTFHQIFNDVVSSLVGATLCTYTGQPLDTIKVRMQTNPNMFRGPIQALFQTAKNEGIRALFKGSIPALSVAVIENPIAFTVRGQLARFFPELQTNNKAPNLLECYARGGATGVCCALVLCPFELVKCKVQVVQNSPNGKNSSVTPLKVTRQIISEKGFRGLYVGFGAHAFRDAAFYSFFFGSYDFMSHYLKSNYSYPESAITFVCGGIAGVLGWGFCFPIDCVKSIQQTQVHKLSFFRTFFQMWKESGLRRLFWGVSPTMIRAFVANAALFIGYEYSMHLLTF